MPVSASMYYYSANMIDCHNCIRAECNIDRQCETNNWATRVNFGILGMLFTDAYLLYKACRGPRADLSSRLFFAKLADALINLDVKDIKGKLTCLRKKRGLDDIYASGALLLEETTSLKKAKTNNSKQGRCSVCRNYTVTTCSQCTALLQTKQTWMCKVHKSPDCWKQHIHKFH